MVDKYNSNQQANHFSFKEIVYNSVHFRGKGIKKNEGLRKFYYANICHIHTHHFEWTNDMDKISLLPNQESFYKGVSKYEGNSLKQRPEQNNGPWATYLAENHTS